MQTYLKLLSHILTFGEDRGDRTGTGTRSVFAPPDLKCNLADGFPLLTTKRVSLKNIITELMWFMRGGTDIKFLHEHGCRIWDPWADKDGNLGPVYGKQWRDWRGIQDLPGAEFGKHVRIDQIENLINGLVENRESRRHIVSAWNPADVDKMALPPCHTLFQCYVHGDDRLDLKLYARSIDAFIGLPYNVASYAMLLLWLANTCSYEPGTLTITFGDLHLYSNHLELAREQMARQPFKLPWVKLNVPRGCQVDAYNHDNIELHDYQSHPAIKAPIAV